ncbi:hypothetical protein CGLO_15977 [Colletotrichum gloeosporioides Cg-14]|uniref:Uncharacterized protein n=1 Tax=Colletotrichum gloeosporioides (strain Cg-14) TaxID=1237896 RepID=T0JXK9_COLGC|nr:hypothetical protein CGLO_15977 [Colletotrichum gloeosporioides Cg-14]
MARRELSAVRYRDRVPCLLGPAVCSKKSV